MALILNDKTITVWNNAKNCNCAIQDCYENHKLCGICRKTIIFGAHESIKIQNNSRGAWNVDHIYPASLGGTNRITNLQSVHIKCNKSKSNSFWV